MIKYKQTPLTLDTQSLAAFNALRNIENTAMGARNEIYKRYAELCGVEPVQVYIDHETGDVSIIEISEK